MFQQIVVIAVFLNTVADANLQCLFCQDAASPTDCDTVVRCGEHELCYVDGYVNLTGTLRYNLGCREENMCTASLHNRNRDVPLTTTHRNIPKSSDKDNLISSKDSHPFRSGTRDIISRKRSNDLLICSECCSGTLCSSAGCGYNGYTSPRGPICFNCAEQLTPGDCSKIKQCGQDEVCMLLKTLNPLTHEVRYKSECSTEKTCQSEIYKFNEMASLFVGKRRKKDHLEIGGSCLVQCCTTDICNVNCGNDTLLTSNSTSPMTSSQTRPPTQTTSTQAGFCMYKNNIYNQGDVWQDGCEFNCTCEHGKTGFYRCLDLCPVWKNLPAGCTLEKKPGECCPQPYCGGHILNPDATANTCFYGGKYHQEGDEWRDGCKYKCTCQDGKTGLYTCEPLCLKWTLPSSCHLDPPPAGKCCEVLVCPSYVHIQYPAGYVQE